MGHIKSLGQFIQQHPPTVTSLKSISPKTSVDKSSEPTQVLGPRPSYAPPTAPSRLDLSTPELRQKELSTIANPETVVRSKTDLAIIKMTGPSQQVKDCAQLVQVMKDPKFTSILGHFSPSLGERFLQAFGKNKGSVDGGRFKKTMFKLVPFINIGSYGRESVRAQTMKKALGGIADHARRQNNQLALLLAESLGTHHKSKRNSNLIGGVIATVTAVLSFIPGVSFTSSVSSALPSVMGEKIGGSLTSLLGIQTHLTTSKVIESTSRMLTATGVEISSSRLQDHYTSQLDRGGVLVGKEKVGSGYGKLKISTRQHESMVKMQAEMGYQAARALINYLGPAQGPDEPDDGPRLELRRSLGATDPSKSYTPSSSKPESGGLSKTEQRKTISSLGKSETAPQDFLQLFFDIGVKGSGFREEG